MRTKSGVLQDLMARLKACPPQNHAALRKMLRETWHALRKLDLESEVQLTPAMVTAVLLSEPRLQLLNEAEQAQLVALGKVALERYLNRTNPPNKLGKTIAASLKETP